MSINTPEQQNASRRSFLGKSTGLALSGAGIALLAGNSQLARAATDNSANGSRSRR